MSRWSLLLVLLCSCREVALFPDATSWPEADALFQNDPRWQGADDAYSVDLGEGRVLWLFADSFIARRPNSGRADSRMVRNSVAIQEGYDPLNASISFFFREAIAEEPTSFFPEEGESWRWPGDGEKVGDVLLVFLMNVHPSDGGFGFEVFGASVALIENPNEPPDQWNIRALSVPQTPEKVILGAATVFSFDGYLYAYSPKESFSHEVYLARWTLEEAAQGELSHPEWSCGEEGFVRDGVDCARPIFGDAQTEFTVHQEPETGRLVVIQTVGFGGTSIGKRSAPAPEGDWSPLTIFFIPPESKRSDVFVYAAKAHPELIADGVALTYVANAYDFGLLFIDQSIYYPRFARVSF